MTCTAGFAHILYSLLLCRHCLPSCHPNPPLILSLPLLILSLPPLPLHQHLSALLCFAQQAAEIGLGIAGVARHLVNLALLQGSDRELLPPPLPPSTENSAQWAQSSGANDTLGKGWPVLCKRGAGWWCCAKGVQDSGAIPSVPSFSLPFAPVP